MLKQQKTMAAFVLLACGVAMGAQLAPSLPTAADSAPAKVFGAPAVQPVVNISQGAAEVGVGIEVDVMHPQTAALGLTRVLDGSQKIKLDGRDRTVLGTKETSNEQGLQTVLLVRDDANGHIDYWQSGLRIALKPGHEPEAFLREYAFLKRRFVNMLYADAMVDAADIASAHNTLSSDPRVESVRFLSVQTPYKPK